MKATYQTRIEPDESLYAVLDAISAYCGELERQLFVDLYIRHRSLNECKKEYIAAHGLTSRQFNAIVFQLKGKVKAILASRMNQIDRLRHQIAAAEKAICRLQKQQAALAKGKGKYAELTPLERAKQRWRIRFSSHNKKRRLARLKVRLMQLKSAGDLPSICFGSRRLFHAQWHLAENGYTTHAAWLQDWQAARSSSFYCLGSKDETAGNQTCTLQSDGTLRLRIPHALASSYSKYIVIPNIHFNYGQPVIEAALATGQAISFRFLCKNGYWYIHATTERKPAEVTTSQLLGTLGVDLNPSVLAVCEIDRCGNPVAARHIPLPIQDRRSEQVLATLGDAVADVVDQARRAQKPIVIEALDFGKKKSQLRETSDRYARMLSGFAYASFNDLLCSRAEREGVEVIEVNPAYTSVIGKVKFMSRYGLSPHAAAAVAIARRGLRFGERLPSTTALSLPDRNRGRHVWAYWHRLLPIVRGRKATHELYKSVSHRKAQAEGISLSTPAPTGGSLQGRECDGLVWAPGCDSPARIVGSTVRPALQVAL